MPASQFTAQGRNRRDKNASRKQGQQPGPYGDASSPGQGSSRGHVVRNLSGQFNQVADDPVVSALQQNTIIQILVGHIFIFKLIMNHFDLPDFANLSSTLMLFLKKNK